VVNGYGPTENTTFTCTHSVADAAAVGATVPIGRPIEGTRVYVLDHALRELPPGVEGELYAAGDGLALGYVGAPELTAERFPEVRLGERRVRMYRTGDRVRMDAAGQIEFLGRADDQVKVRGHRIELEEIRQALYADPAVADAAVLVLGEGSVDKHLAAFVVPARDQLATPAGLRERLGRTLAEYMVPTVWSLVDSIPITTNGKVDRAALVNGLRAHAAPEADHPRRAGEGDLLDVVHDAWADVLGHNDFRDDDDFFDLGGTSLRAAGLVARLRKRSGRSLALRAVFEHPTVAGLAEHLAAQSAETR
jgi:acyl-coenzyme A synthetase/AMP-(fatty) acid ligase/aryl carrier-like protein